MFEKLSYREIFLLIRSLESSLKTNENLMKVVKDYELTLTEMQLKEDNEIIQNLLVLLNFDLNDKMNFNTSKYGKRTQFKILDSDNLNQLIKENSTK